MLHALHELLLSNAQHLRALGGVVLQCQLLQLEALGVDVIEGVDEVVNCLDGFSELLLLDLDQRDVVDGLEHDVF